ncbi:MAG: ribosome recycling factor [Bacteroidetes bacterium]|nr:ribosome recycling factor [Bacteroidota bacterium]
MAHKLILKEAEEKMHKSIHAMDLEFNTVRTGRANPSLLDNVRVEYYGSPMPVSQIATIATPEARLITIQPWEKNMISAIERAIREANLGLNPANDGMLIRLPIPPLNEERRKDLVKIVKKYGEETKVAIRNIRREANEHLKKSEKDKNITQDELKTAEDEVQKLTDRYIKEIDGHVAAKEKEIFEV